VSVLSKEELLLLATERRGRVVNTPALYSGGTGFDSQPPDYRLS
jgi:hypothetical protein